MDGYNDNNADKLIAYLPDNSDDKLGTKQIADVPEAMVAEVTDSTGGVAGVEVVSVGDLNMDNNFASLVLAYENLRVDNEELRTQVNALLGVLRKAGGCGVLDG